MKYETVLIMRQSSKRCQLGNLVMSLKSSSARECEVIIGRPGSPNLAANLGLADTVLYETPDDGVLEIRATGLSFAYTEFMVTQVKPHFELVGGVIDVDSDNAAFSASERDRVSESIARLKEQLKRSEAFKTEELNLIDRKLDDIKLASGRLGRKDWINYVAGAVTSLCISAAFAPEQAKIIFKSLNAVFSWMFRHGPVFLPV